MSPVAAHRASKVRMIPSAPNVCFESRVKWGTVGDKFVPGRWRIQVSR